MDFGKQEIEENQKGLGERKKKEQEREIGRKEERFIFFLCFLQREGMKV